MSDRAEQTEAAASTSGAHAGEGARPSPSDALQREYPPRDVVQILGVTRRQLQYWAQTDLVVPDIERPLSELVLVATGDVVLVFREDSAFEAISGQEWVFEVARFQREVDKWHDLRRARPVRRAGKGGLSRSA